MKMKKIIISLVLTFVVIVSAGTNASTVSACTNSLANHFSGSSQSKTEYVNNGASGYVIIYKRGMASSGCYKKTHWLKAGVNSSANNSAVSSGWVKKSTGGNVYSPYTSAMHVKPLGTATARYSSSQP